MQKEKYNLFLKVLNNINRRTYPDLKEKALKNNILEHIPILNSNYHLDLEQSVKNYDYLFEGNKYHNLHDYIFTDEDFLLFQKEVLKMHIGMFAYADPFNNKLRYLSGPCDYNGDKSKTKPHFFFKSFYKSDKGFEIEPYENHNRIHETNYYIRNSNTWSNYSFVKILKSFNNIDHNKVSKRYTSFEKKYKFIYVSSGELESTLLYWSLLHISPIKKLQLFFYEHFEEWTDTLKKISKLNFEIDFALGLDKTDRSLEKYFQKPYNEALFKHKKQNLIDWIKDFGLILDTKEGSRERKLSERAVRLVEWSVIYLNSYSNRACNKQRILGEENSDFYKIISDKEDWFYNISLDDINNFLKIYDEEGTSFKTLIYLIGLMLVNIDSNIKSKELINNFVLKCRYNPFVMLNMSYAKRNNTNEYTSRAWIVFSVLEDNHIKYYNDQVLHNTGFFFCTIKDSSNEGKGYFEYFEKYAQDFEDQISQIKAMAKALAHVENREIYYSELYDDRKRTNTYDSLYHNSNFFFKDALGKIKKLKNQISGDNLKLFENIESSVDELKGLIDFSKYAETPELILENSKNVNLTTILNSIINIIEFDLLNWDGSILRLREKGKYLEALKSGTKDKAKSNDNLLFVLNIEDNLMLKTYPQLIKIIMKDLITNATRYAVDLDLFNDNPKEKPQVEIILAKKKNGDVQFKISNKCKIVDEAIHIFNTGQIPPNTSLHNPQGLVILNKYCNYLEFEKRLEYDKYFTEIEIILKESK